MLVTCRIHVCLIKKNVSQKNKQNICYFPKHRLRSVRSRYCLHTVLSRTSSDRNIHWKSTWNNVDVFLPFLLKISSENNWTEPNRRPRTNNGWFESYATTRHSFSTVLAGHPIWRWRLLTSTQPSQLSPAPHREEPKRRSERGDVGSFVSWGVATAI